MYTEYASKQVCVVCSASSRQILGQHCFLTQRTPISCRCRAQIAASNGKKPQSHAKQKAEAQQWLSFLAGGLRLLRQHFPVFFICRKTLPRSICSES